MLLFFTPYTYLFLSFYFLVIFNMFSINSFYIFWLFMEILILLFIGVAYTVFTHSYTQLMLYFLFQTIGSFSILVIYLFSFKTLLFFRLFFKLGIFPFFSWYINVLYRFPSSLLFLARTFHKLPPIYIFYLIIDIESLSLLLIVISLTVLVSSVYMLNIYDLRYLIIVSSIGNNSFLLLAVIRNSLLVFSIFYSIYVVTILLILSSFLNIISHSISYSVVFSSFSIILILLLLNLASFPPFPGFFTKFMVFFSCITQYRHLSYYFLSLIIVNVIIIVSYVNVIFKYLINVYGNTSNLVLY